MNLKGLLKRIDKDNLDGKCVSHKDAIQVQGEWLKRFGIPGCYYPYTSEMDMINDLREIIK